MSLIQCPLWEVLLYKCVLVDDWLPSSLMFSPLFLMAISHHTAIQNARANSRTGLVTLREERGEKWGNGGKKRDKKRGEV